MLTKLSEEIFKTTYQYKDESIEGMWLRVAEKLSEAEADSDKWKQDFYSALLDFKFVPGGRILSNAGTDYQATSYVNCFVSGFRGEDQDSMEGIMAELRRQALILKSEGGYGFCCSVMRPRGTMIKGIGSSTPGSVAQLDMWDTQSRVITSGSGKEVLVGKKKNRKGAQMVTAFCVSGDSLVSTLGGKIPIKDLVDKKPYVYCTDGAKIYIRQAEKVWSNGIKKVVRITFDDDSWLDCTPDHKIMLSNGEYKEAKDLILNDSIMSLTKRLYSSRYLHVGLTGQKYMIPEHHAICEMKYGVYPTATGRNRSKEMTIGHHIDENKLNNLPENIQLVTLTEHIKLHGYFKGALDKGRDTANKNRTGKSFVEYYGKEKAKIIYDKASKSRMGKIPWNKGMNTEEYKSHFKVAEPLPNHKVISVVEIEDCEVFDISVPDFHNFVVNNVFAHNCWHPDIEEFITAKQTEGRLTKFNMSVLLTDKFMEAVLADKPWDLIFPDIEADKALYKKYWDGDIEKWIKSGGSIKVYKTLKARDLYDLIMQSTYNRAEPGCLFIDTINGMNNLRVIETINATNPCGRDVCLK